MPELPDLQVYLEAIGERAAGRALLGIELRSPFLLRTVQPPLTAFHGLKLTSLKLLGKRICFGFEGDLWLALHLMIAGRLHWNKRGGKPLLLMSFQSGGLSLTEAGRERRAALHAFSSEQALQTLDQGGRDALAIPFRDFQRLLQSENHTLKRALTDASILSGIGNAYSDEILHRARLSPVALTRKLTDTEMAALHSAMREVLTEWIARLRIDAGGEFPEKVTAFREGMAVHGRYRLPCPACGAVVQRIRYSSNETNYCAVCQTGGRLLADRALSRLLKQDWPRLIGQPG